MLRKKYENVSAKMKEIHVIEDNKKQLPELNTPDYKTITAKEK